MRPFSDLMLTGLIYLALCGITKASGTYFKKNSPQQKPLFVAYTSSDVYTDNQLRCAAVCARTTEGDCGVCVEYQFDKNRWVYFRIFNIR